jgi:hypothetical protein
MRSAVSHTQWHACLHPRPQNKGQLIMAPKARSNAAQCNAWIMDDALHFLFIFVTCICPAAD